MPTSQVPDEDAAMRMFSRKLRYLLANLCDLLDFWFARMKQRKASPRIAARHCNHAQVTASCPSEVTIGLPTMIFSFLFIMSDVPLPAQLTFFLEKTHTHIYIYPLVSSWKIESFHVAKNFLGLGKGTLSRSLSPTLLHLAGGATLHRMRFQAHWEPQALCPELLVAACYRRHGFLAEIRW